MKQFAKHHEWWGVADTLGHALHLPKFIMNPICDGWDNYLWGNGGSK